MVMMMVIVSKVIEQMKVGAGKCCWWLQRFSHFSNGTLWRSSHTEIHWRMGNYFPWSGPPFWLSNILPDCRATQQLFAVESHWLAEQRGWQLCLVGHRQLTTQLSFNEPVFQGLNDGLMSYEIILWVWTEAMGHISWFKTWPPWLYNQISRQITRSVSGES